MAPNYTPEVQLARNAARRLGADRVVILYTTEAGQVGYASYGENKSLCASARRLADDLFDAAMEHFESDRC